MVVAIFRLNNPLWKRALYDHIGKDLNFGVKIDGIFLY